MKFFSFLMSIFLTNLSLLANQTLKFEQPDQVIDVKKGQDLILVDYPFTNTSSTEITIRKFDAPCSCLSAKVMDAKGVELTDQLTFAAGASGSIQALLELGKFKGNVNKKVLVWTHLDKDSSPSIMLSMQVKVPYLIAAFPKSVSWKKSDELTSKKFLIKVTDTDPIRIISHKCSNPHFSYRLETIKEGFEYNLTVIPQSTSRSSFASIQLTTDSKEPRYKKLQCFVSIKP